MEPVPQIQATFLGTGTSQGVPVIGCMCRTCLSNDPRDKRLRSSLLVEWNGHRLVIDSGPDFRQQMLRENVRKLDAILFTHSHKDHIAGLDDIRAFNFIHQQPMDLYAEERVISQLRKEFAYIFAEKKYPGVPDVIIHPIGTDPFRIGSLEVIPIRAVHYRLPVLGFRMGDLTYITDANYIPPGEMKKIEGSRVLILTALRKRRHISHFTLEEAVEIIRKIGPEQGWLTHISHQMGPADEIERELPEGVHLAYDGLKITV
ncbi:MAG: MBL fold metallo-hydrolase [Bacteroidales bacterium]